MSRCKEEAPTVTAMVVAAGGGDVRAWDAIVERYAPLIGSVIVGYRLSGADAEDVAQTVWLRLVEHLVDLREPGALPGWLIAISRNECLRLLRAAQRTRPFDPMAAEDRLQTPTPEPEPDQAVLANERNQLLLAALAELSDQHRELLLLLMEDPPIPYTEISRRLDIPMGSIGPTRARALQRLREVPEFAAWQRLDGAPIRRI